MTLFTDLLPAGGLIVPFAEGTILPAVKADVSLDGQLFLSVLGDPMSLMGASSRTVYADSTRTIAVKAEHDWGIDDGESVQCWNEYVFWTEYVQGTPVADLMVPTLELDARTCPVHPGCILHLSLQEYITDGFADDVYPPAENGYRANPWNDCLQPLLRRHPELARDLHMDKPDQTRYCMTRGRYIVVDYGLPGTNGWALPSDYYEYSEWRNERMAWS